MDIEGNLSKSSMTQRPSGEFRDRVKSLERSECDSEQHMKT